MADFSKVSAGDDLVIPAAAYNAFVDAAIATRGTGGGGTPVRPLAGDTPSVVWVKNNNGSGLARFNAVVLTAPVITPTASLDEFQNQCAMNVAQASSSNIKGAWGVMLDAVPDGEYGRCCVDGLTVANINVITILDRYCDVVASSFVPSTGPLGPAQIVWVAGGVGSASAAGAQWAVIRIGASAPTAVFVKVTGAASGGGGGKYTGTIWEPPTSDVSSTGNLTEANLGTTGATALILNTREVGKSTHDLAASGFLPLVFPGRLLRVNSTGTPVVAIDGYQWEDCA